MSTYVRHSRQDEVRASWRLPVKGKIVLIAGGGSGIGFALPKLCNEAQARVIIGDLGLVPEAQQYLASNPSRTSEIVFKKTNVSLWTELHNLISFCVLTFGDVPDVYAPVAGIFEPP